mgnify:CR=1 FL=1
MEEIFLKMLRERKKYLRKIGIINRFLDRLDPKIFLKDFLQRFLAVGYPKQNLKQKISTENALEYLASGTNFIMDRIGDARNLK